MVNRIYISTLSDSIVFFRKNEPFQQWIPVKSMRPISSTNPANQYGFTLLEILITFVILASVMSIIYSSYTGTFRVINETEESSEVYRMARVAMERMIEDLESIYMPEEKKNSGSKDENEKEGRLQFYGEDREIKGMPADSIRFISRAHIDLGDHGRVPGITEIVYYVKEDEDSDTFVLFRSNRSIFEDPFSEEEDTGGMVLCEGLVSVEFYFFDEEGEAFKDWDSDSDEFKNRVPEIISISLKFTGNGDPENPINFITKVAPPMAMGQG